MIKINPLFVLLDLCGYLSEKAIPKHIKVHIGVLKIFFIVNTEKNWCYTIATIFHETQSHISIVLTSHDLEDELLCCNGRGHSY